jgi:tripartite-type tricarboxylate transporter receptor subunit TctC
MFGRFIFSVVAITALTTGVSRAEEQSVANFYKGKTITLIIGNDIGGGYDTQGRLMSRHLGQHIPGTPSFVVQNMPTAGGVFATNHLYNLATKDGTVIGLISRGMLVAKLTKPEGVRFDVEKFNWIGSISNETTLVAAWHTAQVKTAQDLLSKELIVGGDGPSADPEATARLLNSLIGTHFKIVSGYKGNNDILMAMERGEVEGIADWSWSNIKATKGEYLRDHKINLLMQVALDKAPDLPDVPLAIDYAKNDNDRKVMSLFFAQKAVARPVLAPPGVPADRVAALRKAFVDMSQDPKFVADAAKMKLDINPSASDSVESVIKVITSTPLQIAKQLAEAVAPPK